MARINEMVEKLSDPKLKKFMGQNFDDIRTECFSTGEPWTDPEFGPDENSLGMLNPNKETDLTKSEIEWKRAHEINKEAKLFIKGYCEDDVIQGRLGDCWFSSSVASLALQHSLVEKVIPHSKQQVLHGKDYCGALLFRFHRFGEWIEVVVDDYLPTKKNSNELVFMHSQKPPHEVEFWAAFLEKAYAKLDGSYGGLILGKAEDALDDLTGGISERIDCQEVRKDKSARHALYRHLKKAISRHSVVTLAINKKPGEFQEETGLVARHIYSLLRCFDVPEDLITIEDHGHELVKVRNPWGHGEWKGKWSDTDPIWSQIPQEVKKALKFTNEDDGEFWMEFDDLLNIFNDLTICRIVNTGQNHAGGKSWHQVQKKSAWVPGLNAGGCSKYKDTFFTNPQFQFQIEHEHDETVQIVMAQPDTRRDKDKTNMYIGFKILKVAEGNTKKVDSFHGNRKIPAINKYLNDRQLFKRFHNLRVGTYVIIPSTFRPGKAGEFLLRILTEKEAYVTELKD